MEVIERFETLDPERWVDSYLPAWSSRAASAAAYDVGPDGLRLTLPADHPVWCADLHEPRLRVSALQSGSWSGPVGSSQGQQPFHEGLLVTEEQPRHEGHLVRHGRIEVECRATIGPGSMFSAWLIGMEDQPDRCGEICLVEVFGHGIKKELVDVGTGIHAFRDPVLTEEFGTEHRLLDVADWHRYAVEWTPQGITWHIDGETVRHSHQSPAYPMLLVLGLFDFPDEVPDPTFEPALEVREVRFVDP